MKILILGSNGMAGHMLLRYLKEKNHDVQGSDRNDFDVLDTTTVDNFFNSLTCTHDIIINCIGMLMGESNNDLPKAILINSWFPKYLEKRFAKSDIKIIHVSTDCVFDGIKGNYVENESPTETSNYGVSKAHGEINNKKDLTLRTSIIGPEISDHRTGLLDWVLHRSPMQLQGWHDAWWNGVTTLQLAKCIEHIIVSQPSLAGLYHLAADPINKYDLVRSIVEIYGLTKSVESTNAPKYINKVLVDTRKELKLNIPSHRDMLQQLLEFNK
jgi:dTDP-4-dehydrorhamnose reductase